MFQTFWKKQHTSFGFKNKFDYIPTPQEIQNLRSWKKKEWDGKWLSKSPNRMV